MDEPAPDQTDTLAEGHVPGPDANAIQIPDRHGAGSTLGSIFTIWIAPRWTARRYQHTPLWMAWLDHALAGVIAFIVAFVGVALFEGIRSRGRMDLSVFWRVMDGLAYDLVVVWEDVVSTRRGLLVLAVGLAWIEALFAFAAFVVAAWSARDEPLRRTFGHALRTAWLWTGTIVPSLVVFGAVAVALRSYRLAWAEGAYDIPATVEPWLIRYATVLLPLTALALFWWAVFVLLRAAAAARESLTRVRPPICEGCGYNLSHTPRDSRCPECGTPVRESVDPGVRRPKEWELVNGIPLRPLLECGFDAVLRPRHFFRTMQARCGLPRARSFLVVLVVLAISLASLCAIWIALWTDWRFGEVVAMILISPVFVLLTLVYTLGLATAVAVYCRWVWNDNVAPGVAKVFCYTYGLVLFLAGVYAICSGPVAHLAGLAGRDNWQFGTLDGQTAIAYAWLVVAGLCMLVHLRVAMIGARQVRYANS